MLFIVGYSLFTVYLSLAGFTGYNSSFNHFIVEENQLPQSRHRKKKGRSNTRQTHSGGAGLNKREKIIVLVVLLALIATAIVYLITSSMSSRPSSTASTTPVSLGEFDNATPSASGLKYVDVEEGTGKTATAGQEVTVAYTGTLTNGTQFDSSSKPGGRPYTFRLGTGNAIQGWHEGIAGMKVGGKRKLLIPPALGYGAGGRPPQIPGNSILLFDVELLDAK
jgi:peptidylprolyl isomerase